jgi:hypothetical protein
VAYDTFTALLNAAEFPFIADFFQRSIIIPSIDQPPRLPRYFAGAAEASNPELAQHFYCQNVLPTAEGLASVGFTQVIPALSPPSTEFDQAIILRDVDENNFLYVPARGKNYIYRADSPAWQSVDPFVGWTKDIVSRAYVNGRTFVHFENFTTHEYNTSGNTFPSVPFSGLNNSDVTVIGASNNYLIAVAGITVYWSSLVDPTDFVPSLQTGAGNAIPQDMKGIARAIVPISGGFVIYTTKNAIAALYTNNARAPFVFREISNAGGVMGPEQISLEATLGFHYAWTTGGLQKISSNNAESLSSGAMDFLAGRVLEEFDLTTKTLTFQRLNEDLKVKLTYVSSRFLVISYGRPTNPLQVYTHALVYDLGLKRWGKLRIDHVDCLLYPYPNLPGVITETPPKRSLAFLKSSGQIDLVIMDYRERANQGVILLGKYQLIRQKRVTFQFVELEGLHQAYPPSVFLQVSYDGKKLEAPEELQVLLNNGDGGVVKYGAPAPTTHAKSRTGVNFTLGVIGSFELNTATFTITRHGNR